MKTISNSYNIYILSVIYSVFGLILLRFQVFGGSNLNLIWILINFGSVQIFMGLISFEYQFKSYKI